MSNLISLNEKIFIAGSTGMAGSSILRKLMSKGYGKKSLGGEILSPRRKELDLLDTNKVKEWFKSKKPTIVILAAAKVGGIQANSKYCADFIMQNLKIQTNVIEAAWENNVKRLLFLGSSCIYPRNATQPIKEEYLLSNKLEATNEAYAIAKIAGLKLCENLNIQYGFDAITLMPTNLYGPGDNYHSENSHVMAALIKKFAEAVLLKKKKVVCWGSGIALREFLHVDDLGSAAVFSLENWNPKAKNSPKDNLGGLLYFLNVGTGKDISIKELALKIAKISGFKGDIIWDINKPDGTPRKVLDTAKINQLGWKPEISLNDGLERTFREYFRKLKF